MPDNDAQEAEVIIDLDLDDTPAKEAEEPVVEPKETPEPKTEAPKQGKRAEKRIRNLVASNKELRPLNPCPL